MRIPQRFPRRQDLYAFWKDSPKLLNKFKEPFPILHPHTWVAPDRCVSVQETPVTHCQLSLWEGWSPSPLQNTVCERPWSMASSSRYDFMTDEIKFDDILWIHTNKYCILYTYRSYYNNCSCETKSNIHSKHQLHHSSLATPHCLGDGQSIMEHESIWSSKNHLKNSPNSCPPPNQPRYIITFIHHGHHESIWCWARSCQHLNDERSGIRRHL